MATILITGSSGFLGHNLVAGLIPRHRILAGYYRAAAPAGEAVRLDIRDSQEVIRRFEQLRPDLVIHAAAMSHPDECEKYPDTARTVIVEGSRNIASAARLLQCRLLHISTDLVFDGTRGNYTEEDEVLGISVYSRTKIEAERLVAELVPEAVVLRVALLYGPGNPTHPGQIDSVLKQWRAGQALTFFTDQYRTPAFAPQVVDVVESLLVHPEVRGILHLGGADRVSRYDFARLLADHVGAPAGLIRPGSMWDVTEGARRGADCSLVSHKIRSLLGIEPLSCAEGLKMLRAQHYLRPLT